ncbi:virulence plasmid kda a protein [Leptolyngbya sp. Heron Island J]|uniref:LamG-like jellyroll fold domain-containing protein n=1 Tax=Leptolyngbya sp. Heron Island J TaxID=1385935 RepID=UPI0003B9F1D9|nr:LamG-like jellyroll fold domain-containing protein [Leptolyngbya sp. Heron Island J]ESA33674.1 virulence plasmid kda a protein [Leptolyngbya sp. Heron Island J]
MSTASSPLTDRAAFERFKEANPQLGLALKIAAIPEIEFVKTYGEQLEDGERQAYRIHQTAVRVQQQAALVWANLKDAASPFLQQTLFNNIPPSFLEQQQRIPGYDRLFGSLDYIECDESRSVLSPAAYFVDLMRFIEETITGNNTIPAECQLDQRRPDLLRLRLDEDNTFSLIPYIDLVNEVLETLVTDEENPNAEAVVAAAVFPQSLPLNLPLAEIRAYLQQLDWNLSQIYDTFATATDGQHQQREQLALSPQELALLGSPLVDEQLAAVYGFETMTTTLSALASVDVFLERTGLTRQELNDLVYQDLDRFEVNAGLSRLFFINAVDDGLGQLTIQPGSGDSENPTRPPQETLLNLSAAKLDRIYRFLKLARRLEWSFADLDWALRALDTPYNPERVLQFDGLNDFVDIPAPAESPGEGESGLAALQGTFTVEAWVNPSRHQANPILSRGMEDNTEIHFLLCLTPDGRVTFYGSAAAEESITSLQTLTVGEFSHVAVTVQSSDGRVQIYINGELDREGSLPAVQPPAGNLAVNIGRNLSDITFAGLIKDVRIWSDVRTAAAVFDNRYRRLTGFETNLVAYWPLTETHGIELLDRTPYRQHGIPGGDRFVTQPTWIGTDLVLEPLPDRIGATGYQFNGIDQFLAARGVTGLDVDQFTLEAWIYLEAAGHNTIITKGNAGNRQTQFLLWVDEQNRLVFRSTSFGAQEYRSQSTVALQTFTHVAVAVSAETIDLYLDGVLDQGFERPDGAIDPRGDDLVIGNDFSDRTFHGIIQAVRLWNHARSASELNSFMQRAIPALAPGLIGYWPLNEITGEVAADQSVNNNPLYLGGVPADFQPESIPVAPLLPALPVAVPGSALQFDGDQDLLVLRHEDNLGLGRYPRFTLEFWFKPTEQAVNPETPQLLFSQGDGEAGLAVYLERQQLRAIAWCANYELTEVQETVLASGETAVTPDQWHHIAIVHDETQNLDYIEFRGFLNGTALDEISNTHGNTSLEPGQRGYHLSPVGVVYLGGIDTTGMTRFQGTYLQADDARLRGFSGQMADLRLWQQARTLEVIEAERYRAPGLEDLITYLPLDEGQDITVTDRVGGYTGQLRGQEAVFMAAAIADPELENRYTHYAPEGEAVLDWSNYGYTGMLYVPAVPDGVTAGGLGVTFLSRHPDQVDQFYRLQVTWPAGQPTFGLTAHPQGVQPLTLGQADFPTPTPGTWYHFWLEVTDAADRTNIAVTLWPEGERRPANAQVTAYDDSDVRITSGAVGLWVAGDQPETLMARFNNLRVVTLDGAVDLLVANFKDYLPGENPIGWVDTCDLITPQDASGLFGPLDLQGRTVLGTDSTLDGIHSHYFPAGSDVLTWTNYSYRGKVRFSDAASGIGLTVLSRTPEKIDQYYVLRRDAEQPTLHLAAHPLGVQPLTAEPGSSLDSGLLLQPETDYFVLIEVNSDPERTQIQAKVWEAGTLEPSDFQIRAFDDSDIRISTGTVGIWAAGPGTKTFDHLTVHQETLFAEDFSVYGPDAEPVNWLDTGANNSREEVPELFRTANIDGGIVLRTQSQENNIHSHYQAAEALAWTSYSYTGRMLATPDENGNFSGIGITFFSRYTDAALDNHDQYYRLRRFSGIPTLHIAPHPHDQRQVEFSSRDTGVNPLANTWYQFLIEVNDTGSRTQMRAKVWPEGTPEPAAFQAETFDDNNSNDPNRRRLTAGTIGLWAQGEGEKHFDDLQVRRGVYLSADLALEDWQSMGARTPFAADDTLFVAERIPDQPMWLQVEDIPLLRQPLNLRALDFDGDREYLALAALQGEIADRFTLEAWIQPASIGPVNPIFSWGETTWFGLNNAGQVTLVSGANSLSGATILATDAFTHVAVTVAGDSITLYVNGVADGEGTFAPMALAAVIDVGRFGEQYFGGQIRDLRLWNTALTEFPIHQRYQTPDFTSTDLLAAWAFADFENAYALDSSANGNHLRLGGLEPARKPTLFERELPTDNTFFQPGRPLLTFSEAEDGILIPVGANPVVPKRHTVEVWVKVTDPDLSGRRQVIYHSGDAQQGLVMYVHDGLLHFGGYNQALGWQGTWVQTDRMLAKRWHHVALVLDGRAEVRPGAFRAYLDGKLVGFGDGSQLSTVPAGMVGAAAGDIRFHDGMATAVDTYLEGAVLELRLWDTARTSAEIADYRYVTLATNEPNLALWWRFQEISVENPVIRDDSGRDRTATLDNLDRLQSLAALTIGSLPTPILSQDTLLELATGRQLMERHRRSVEQLTALWYDLRHTGRADDQVFFDRVFNPTGLTADIWSYHDPARRWDITGQELPSRDRSIRSRLMGALQLSSDDLDRIVALVSGTETPVEVDTPYLRQLYRLSQIPRVLRLTVDEYLVLLEMLGLTGVESLTDLALISDRITELRRIGLRVDELNFFANDVPSDRIRPPFTDANIRVFADEVVNQSVEYLLAPLTLTSDDISELQSATIVDFLKPGEDTRVIGALTTRYFVDDLGAVTDRYQVPEDLRELAIAQNWATPFADLGTSLFTALQTAGFVNEYGIILRSEELDQFPKAFGDSAPSPTVLADIQAVLENQNNRQTTITETLVNYRNEHRSAILAGLSELLGTDPEPLQAVLTYFQSVGEPLSDPSRLLDRLMSLEETQPIPTELLDYCFRLYKILLLVTRFELTTAEIQILLEHPVCFSVSDVFRPTLTDLVNLFTFTELKTAFGGDEDQLVQLLSLEPGSSLVTDAILQISGWDSPQLQTLMAHFGANLSYNRVENLLQLQRGFALAETLRVDISFMLQLAATDDLSLTFYRQQADVLLPALRALYDDEQWPQVFRPLRDPLAIQKRDALLAVAMEDIPTDFEGRRSPDLLSEYLLLDMQVSSAVETSRIVQGTAALQQYVQRCLMNLEKGVDPATIPTDQWEWMQNFRVWEANRKVFLFPESFIEPELRDTKTPLFAELEQELMQGEINQDAVTQAYTRYLNRFTEVANLKIVGSYRHKPLDEEIENANQDEILYLLGRTQSQPARFFYRTLINNTQWQPWQEIDLVIDSEQVSPVFAFGRLFLFWAELTKLSQPIEVGPVTIVPSGEGDRANQTLEGEGVTQQDIEDYRAERRSLDNQGFLVNNNTGERVQRNVDVFRPTVRYSYLNADGSWITPQNYLELEETIRAEQAILPSWQRVAAQRVLTLNQDNEIPQENNAQVLELNSNTTILNTIPRFDMRRLTWSFWVKLDNQRPNGFLGTTEPVSSSITLFEYGNRLRGLANANINPIQGLREAVTQASALATTILPQLSLLSVANEDTRENIVTDLQTSIQALEQARAVALTTTNPNLTSEVTNLVDAINGVINTVNSAISNTANVSAAIAAVNQLIAVVQQTPQWETTSWRLTLSHEGASPANRLDVDLPYDVWQHIAITFDYQQGGDYELNLYVGDEQTEVASVLRDSGNLSEMLPSAQVLSIGRSTNEALLTSTFAIATRDQLPPEPLNPFFTAQLSEFRLWEQVRDVASISATRNERRSGQEFGLFYLPLNRAPQINVYQGTVRDLLADRNTLVSSSLDFRLTAIVPVDAERERIILFYGNQVRSIRNNLEEQSFTLQLENRFADITNYDVNLSLFSETGNINFPNSRGLILHLSLTNGLSLNDYADGEHSTLNRFTPASLRLLQEQITSLAFFNIFAQLANVIEDLRDTQAFSARNFLLRNLPRYEASMIDVGNQPGWYILDTGDEQYLVQVNIDNLKTAGERIRFEYGQSSLNDVRQQITVYFDRDDALEAVDPDNDANLPLFRFTRLSTFAVHDLSVKLFTEGIEGLLSLRAQQTEEFDFNSYQPFTHDSDSGVGLVLTDGITETLDFDGAYGLYYREIFFHIPFFIANQLNTNQNFADAQRWYHYIFNPTSSESSNGANSSSDRFWQYLPLRNLSLETLRQMLGNEEALAEYQSDPFDPHAIARLRINAYQKAIVMKYIDNLLDWGDNLFAQDNRESINQAFLLYILAFNLLGPRPEARADRTFEEIGNYQGIREAFDDVPEFLTELDLNGNVAARTSTITLNQNGNIITTFCVPENSDFIGFWDRVESRLFNIRHSLNIEGIFRQLALFQPPLDVRALVQAAAAGGRDIGSLLADVNVPVPHYRYGFMLERAKEIIGNVKDFGAVLLDVLEKRDAEQLATLQTTHERDILNLTTAVREAARDEARTAIGVLRISEQRTQEQIRYLEGLIEQSLIPAEQAGLGLMIGGNILKLGASGLKLAASFAFNVPETTAGAAGAFGSPVSVVSFGGGDVAEGLTTASDIVELIGDTTLTAGEIADRTGEYIRRASGWAQDLTIAQFDLSEIQEQIAIAELQLQMAERELEIHNRQIEQNQELATFYRSKFTNEALYNWMISRLAGMYFQSYRLAYDFAKSAERALQFELPTNDRFINFGHWDSLRRGLLAGEALLLDVNRMEKFHLDNDSRFQEIEKIIPLSRVDQAALLQLLGTGECNFSLNEALFNRDYPGHYFRVIKSISLSLKFVEDSPLVDDPYFTVNASLTQVGNKTLLDPDINAVRYLMGIEGATQPGGTALRVNWRSNQQIAVSSPRQDNGMFGSFDLNFVFDDRYFPFEGTGAVSNWHLEIPLENNPDLVQRIQNANVLALEDVVIHIKYTSKFDRSEFRTQVQEEVRTLDQA